ncbi:BA14K-like protein [Breoghania corrubedonensis]|uniref:Lectin-like protein BA14k n=1 Tax=Breoghania corrubedonensis TaxID=665038 RepID=A0A2T5VCX0_9HYPH|nr:BA14K family protein [Breoghania corrubedonensis]PTW61600.1 BA14K-like protein [Breoghania corrubedonensis]
MALTFKAVFGALACLLALMWFSAEPAAAMPTHAAAPAATQAAVLAGTGVLAPTSVHYRNWRHRHWRDRHWRDRHWRGRDRYWRQRHYRPGLSFWFGSGGVGVPYGYYGYRPGPYYRGPVYYGRPAVPPRGYYYRGRPAPGTPDWYAYCASKYKSFNPRTGRYLAYSGKYRRCR